MSPSYAARQRPDRLRGSARQPRGRCAPLAVFRIAFGLVGLVVSGPARGLRLDRPRLYAGPAPPLHLPRLRLGAPAVERGDAGPRSPSSRWPPSLVAAGCWHRPAIVAFFVGFTWIELIDVTTYLNHYWFLTLAALLLLRPAGRRLRSRSTPWRRGRAHRARRRGVAAPGPGRRGLRLRGPGQAATPTGWCARCRCGSGSRPRAGLGLLVGSSTRAGSPTPSPSPARSSTASWCRCCSGGGPGRRLARRGGLPRLHLGAVPDRRVPLADDRRRHRVLRARLAAPAARPLRPSRRPLAPIAPRRCAGTGPPGGRWPACWMVVQVALPLRHLPTRATTAGRARATASRGTCCSSRSRATSSSWCTIRRRADVGRRPVGALHRRPVAA